ncbi:helix-turn-helix domain-containing protein [Alicyclobacillus dauci]|uniref:Helix-turn-helix domain-containing protein n=1 Tax=Alicyclobacillus dauci TaxID=1475485 RepID=A0ABY6Z8U1_9BACL|nr:helix-turn-helix domain-containing protein [Alicyclobacillus dauci]WAH38576.1 helix-turn-helix domain-containing protein [Alicyclobacillus dauci]
MASFAQRFKELREKRWTQDEAAEALGVSRSTIAGYESDTKGRIPRQDTLRKIADVFGVSVDYLLGRDDPSTKTEDDHVSPEEREFLDWVKEHVTGTFFYDFDKSPEESKREMMRGLKLIYEMEKGRKPGQKQGE